MRKLKEGNAIDVDGNALAWKLGTGKHVNEILHLMAVYLKDLAHSGGFIVTVVMDGTIRPDCKRESWFRRKDRELDDVNRFYCRFKALELGSAVNRNENADAERNTEKRMGEFELYNSEAKRLERKCSHTISFPNDFEMRLSEKLMMLDACNKNENGGYVKDLV